MVRRGSGAAVPTLLDVSITICRRSCSSSANEVETWSFEQRHRLQTWDAGEHHFECVPVLATSHFEQVAKLNCVAST